MLLSRHRPFLSTGFEAYLWALIVGVVIGVASFVSPILAAGLVVVAILLLIALNKPTFLLGLYALAVIVLSGMPRDYLVPMFVPNEPLLVAVIGLGILIVLRTDADRRKTERVPSMVYGAMAILFLGIAVVPTIIYLMRGWQLGVTEIFGLFAPIQYLMLFWLAANLPRNEDERLELIHFMIFCSSIVSLTGLLQAVNFPPLDRFFEMFFPGNLQLEQALAAGRVTSILGAWNSLGNFLMLNTLMILSVFNIKQGRGYIINLSIALLLNLACMVASGSFASIGGFLLALAIMKFFDRRGMKLLMWIAILAVIAVIVMLPLILVRLEFQFGGPQSTGTPQTLEYRFYLWETIFLPALAKHNNWIWGITPVLSTGIFTWAWPESQYFFLLIRSGLISLVAHLLWVGVMIVWLGRLRKTGRTDLQRSTALVLFALFFSLTLMGFTNEVFTNSGSIDFFWLYLGLTAKSGLIVGSHREPRQAEPPVLTIMPVTPRG